MNVETKTRERTSGARRRAFALPRQRNTFVNPAKSVQTQYRPMRRELFCLQDKYRLTGQTERWPVRTRRQLMTDQIEYLWEFGVPITITLAVCYALDRLASKFSAPKPYFGPACRYLIRRNDFGEPQNNVTTARLLEVLQALDFSLMYPTCAHFFFDTLAAAGQSQNAELRSSGEFLLWVAVCSDDLVYNYLSSEIADAVTTLLGIRNPAGLRSEAEAQFRSDPTRVVDCIRQLTAEYGLYMRSLFVPLPTLPGDGAREDTLQVNPGEEIKTREVNLGEETKTSLREELPPPRATGEGCSPSRKLRSRETAEYKAGRILGEGGFGRVYLAEDLETGTAVAIKEIVPDSKDLDEDEEPYGLDFSFVAELAFLKDVTGPHLLKLLDVGVVRRKGEPVGLTEVLEQMETSLVDLDLSKLSLTELLRLVKSAGRQLFSALRDLHAYNVAHLDIKPDNFLLTIGDGSQPVEFRLADLGLASWLCVPGLELYPLIGTVFYHAPEQMVAGDKMTVLSTAVDNWSLGYVLLRMLDPEYQVLEIDALGRDFGLPTVRALVERYAPTDRQDRLIEDLIDLGPDPGKDLDQVLEEITERAVNEDEATERLVRGLSDFFVRILEPDPFKRLTAEEALRHPFLA